MKRTLEESALPKDEHEKVLRFSGKLHDLEPDLASIVLFGSGSHGEFTANSDLDLWVVTHSDTYRTDPKTYRSIAASWEEPMRVAVRTTAELDASNLVTLKPGFAGHVANGLHVAGDFDSLGALDACLSDESFGRYSAEVAHSLFESRKWLLLSNYRRHHDSANQLFFNTHFPSFSLWHDAVRGIIKPYGGHKIPRILDNRSSVVKMFYDSLGLVDQAPACNKIRDEYNILKQSSNGVASPSTIEKMTTLHESFKELVEEGFYSLNGYLRRR